MEPKDLEVGQSAFEWKGEGSPRGVSVVLGEIYVPVVRTRLVEIAQLREKHPGIRGVPVLWAGPGPDEEEGRLEFWSAAGEGLKMEAWR